MARQLTHSELFRHILDALDEAGSPRWDRIQVGRVLNEVYADWFRSAARQALERDEQARRDLGPLTLTTKQDIGAMTFRLDTLEPGLYRIIAVSADWQRLINRRGTGRPVLRQESWPVTPIRHDELAVAQVDPFNKPANSNARYSESLEKSENGRPLTLTLYCSSQPKRLTITYLFEPDQIDLTQPERKTEVGYDVQLELIRRSAALLATRDENYNAAQSQYQELQLTS